MHIKPQTRATATSAELNESTGDRNIQHKVDDHCADALRYLLGPLYVMGAGTHFSDIYDTNGNQYEGSESEDFLKLHGGVTLDNNDPVFTAL